MILNVYHLPSMLDFDFYKNLLDEKETIRLEKMQSPTRKHSFLVGRYAIRTSIAKILNIEPKNVKITIAKSGRPEIETDTPISFNISHTKDYLALVVASQHVSIDMEHKQNRNFDRLIKFFKNEKLEKDFIALPINQKPDAFYKLWVEYESGIKYYGSSVFFINTPKPPFVKSFKVNDNYWLAVSAKEPITLDNNSIGFLT